jgi:hypothetical protein
MPNGAGAGLMLTSLQLLTDHHVAHTRVIDNLRIVDYDEEWNVGGVELIGASAGHDT